MGLTRFERVPPASELKFEYMRQRYGEMLVKLGERYNDIVVLDADLSASTKTSVFASRFPERFFNVGVAEQNLMGIASGLAAYGKRVFVSTFAIFATGRAWEQIRQSIAYGDFPVRIVATHGGITVGEDGATHQATEDIALMRAIPGMSVIVPADPVEVLQVIEFIVDYNHPVYVRLSRNKFPIILDESHYRYQYSRAQVIAPGKDVSIFACGYMVYQSLMARDILREKGIEAEIINASTIKPLNVEDVVRPVKRTGRAVTVEEHQIIGGLGSAVAEILVENHPVPLLRLGIRDRFGLSGSANALLSYFGLDANGIASAVEAFLKQT